VSTAVTQVVLLDTVLRLQETAESLYDQGTDVSIAADISKRISFQLHNFPGNANYHVCFL
jgi:hypothetical protein